MQTQAKGQIFPAGPSGMWAVTAHFRGFVGIFAMTLALMVMGCDSLTFSKQSAREEYKFAGLQKIQLVSPGRYRLEWPKADLQGEPVYEIFSSEQTGPKASTNQDLKFEKAAVEVKEPGWVSPVVTFQNSVCFAVRVKVGNVSDTNQNIKCTKHEKFVFPGIQSLGVAGAGKFRLAWPAVPDPEAEYSVYVKTSSAGYNFSADPLARITDRLYETKSFPLYQRVCFVVRAISKNSPVDQNVHEICSDDDGVSDFKGIDTAKSIVNGQATVTWVPSVNKAVVGYRVYIGNSFEQRAAEIDAKLTTATITGLPSGERREFGVRAYDKNGREDDNDKTISVVISDAQVASGDFPGCVSATALGTNRISVAVVFPEGASSMQVYRDGVLVGSLNAGSNELIDDKLTEATTYSYRCQAFISGVPTQGTSVVQGSTLNLNPPNFTGLSSALRTGAGTVKLVWPSLGDGPKAKEFRVYKKVGVRSGGQTDSEFAQSLVSADNLVATLPGSTLEYAATGLGDELRYSFVVTACSISGLCAGTTKPATTALLSDDGIPKTPGATSVRMSSGKAVITAPWVDSMGALAVRKIYLRKGECTSPSTCRTIGNFLFEFKRDVVVSDVYAPPTELEMSVESSKSYTFAVLDVDPSGNYSQNTASVTINSGDILPPSFAGISSLVAGSNPETQLVASFTAIAPEGSGAGQSVDGPSEYLVYKTESSADLNPTDPCVEITPVQQISALSVAAGAVVPVTLSGLSARRNYRICLKARDAATNLSVTTSSITATTQDRTPPVFAGLQTLSYNNASSKLELRWNSATAALGDLRGYNVTLWRCPSGVTPVAVDCSTAGGDSLNLTRAQSSSSTGTDVAKTDFAVPLASNDKVTVLVEGCDNASTPISSTAYSSPIAFGSADNCSASGRKLSVTLPDVDPPAGFAGLQSVAAVGGVEGALRLSWNAPAPSSLWSDYRGFKIYSVASDQSLTFVKDCLCTASNCVANPITSCDVQNLDARRTYNYYARAFDAVNNLTAVSANPYAERRSGTSLDLTSPTFVPNLSATFVNSGASSGRGVLLSWAAATDNQYVENSAALTYKVYRSVGSAFTGLTATTPPSNGTQLVGTAALTYLNALSDLTANTTEYYTVCAFDSSNNAKCDPTATGVRSLNIPRLTPPTFAGLTELAVGSGAEDTSLTLSYQSIDNETVAPSTGADEYTIYITEAVVVDVSTQAPSACDGANTPTSRGTINGAAFLNGQAKTYTITGLTPRKNYSVCLKARDRLGNESVTTAALNKTTLDISAPSFGGIQNSALNGSTGKIDLAWVASTSSDIREYRVKIWKTNPAGTPVTLVVPHVSSATTGYSLATSDFPFASNDALKILVQACDNASPLFNSADNCTAYADSTARDLLLPDVDPPVGFTGIKAANATPSGVSDSPSNSSRTTGAVVVNWASMDGTVANWTDVRGFRVYNVTNESTKAITLLRDCACAAAGCSEKLTSCTLTGLDPGRTYKIYLRAYDAAPGGGNETAIALPNPITNNISFRTADLVAPSFSSALAASWSGASSGISLTWSAATDNQYSLESGNTVGYRLYRKTGSAFSATTRSTIESEGTLVSLAPDTARTFLDPLAGLVSGSTYHYTVCAFDRESKDVTGATLTGGNTTCDGVVRSATVPDTVAPVIASLAARDATTNTSAVTLLTRSSATFNLNWTLSDNVTPNSQINVFVRRKITTSSTDFPASSDTLYTSGANLTQLAAEQGNDNENAWITYRITAQDVATNSSDVTFAIQSNRAAIPTTLGTPTATVLNASGSSSVPLNWTGAANTISNAAILAKITATVVSGNPSCTLAVAGSGTSTRNINLTACSGNGVITLSVAAGSALDGSSNPSSTAGPSAAITVDNTAPSVAITSPAATANFNYTTAVSVSGSCSENGRTVTLGGSGIQTGATPTCSAATFTTTVTLVSDDGPKILTATQADAAGNSTTSSAVSVNLDTTAPNVSLSSPTAGTAGQSGLLFAGTCEAGLPVNFTGTGVLNDLQTANCTAGSYLQSVTFSSGDGSKSISVGQVDLAGNTSIPVSVSLVRDNQAPTVSLSTPSVSLANSTASINYTLTFSDSTSSVASISLLSAGISINATGSAACSKAVTGVGTVSRTVTLSSCSGSGAVSVSVAAAAGTDAAGNASAAAGPSVSFTVDNTAPNLAITAPAANTQINTALTITGTCEGSLGISISSSGVVGSPVSTTCAGGGFSQALTLSGADGNKTLNLSSSDAAGNTSTASVTVVRDTTAPPVSIASPAANTVFNNLVGNLPLTGSCESGLTVNLNGDVPAGQSTTCSAGAYSFAAGSWSLNSGEGTKSVTVSQTDAAGNVGTSAARNYTINTLAVPLSSAPGFDAVTAYVGMHVTVTGTCDSGAAFATTATSSLGTVVSTTCANNVLSIKLTNLPEGKNTFTVTATTTRIANGLTRVTSQTFNQQFFCPQGYVGIPGKFSTDSDVAGLGNVNASTNNADAGLDPTRDFCIMKYPAKVATSNNGGSTPWEPVHDGNNSSLTMANYWPQSRASSTPWVRISRDQAIDRCKALNEAHGLCSGTECSSSFDNSSQGYRLMSNTQWQVAARNLENTGANWSGGTVGSGFLWRGQTDNTLGTNTDLYTQTYVGATQLLLSNPRSDTGVSDYFGTGNSVSQNTSASSGWQERRRFVTSSGASLWDFAGNGWQWVADNNCNGKGASSTTPVCASDMGVNGNSAELNSAVVNTGLRAAATFWEYNNAELTASDLLLFGSAGRYTSTKLAGLVWGSGASGGAVLRAYGGLFGVWLANGPGGHANFGFRCAFVPPMLTGPLDTGAPSVTGLQRVDSLGASTANSAVTVGAGGLWHLGFSVFDPENTGTSSQRIRVKVRRKIATTNSDFPVATDAIYKQGFNNPNQFNLPESSDVTARANGYLSVSATPSASGSTLYLSNETAWTLDETTGQYTRNDGKFVNYLVTAIDPTGNTSSATYSVQVTQSCPPGYVGVPGNNVTGLGNVNAIAGNANKQLDPSLPFCVMKYPAKVMSAGTTTAQSTVGGKFEPIKNGNATFTNDYTYTNASTFDSKVIFLPESRPTGTPWVNISRDNSISACQALQQQYLGTTPDATTGTGFQLISNTQWQVVARNAEAQAVNWSNNAVGSGVLNRGHSDNAVSATEVTNSWCFGCTAPSTNLSALPNSVSDSNSYFATGNSSATKWNELGASPTPGTDQKRTHSLSNGATLWDFSGNIAQYVQDNNCNGKGVSSTTPMCASDMGVSGNSAALNGTVVNTAMRIGNFISWEYNNVGLTTSDQLLFGGAYGYTTAKNAGFVYSGAGGAVLRGGTFNSGFPGGLFTAALPYSPLGSGTLTFGFRCAFVP